MWIPHFHSKADRDSDGVGYVCIDDTDGTLGARGFFFRSETATSRDLVILPREKKTLWTQQLQTSLPCDFETKHLTKPVFAGSVCFSICMSARGATMRETGQKLSQDEDERNCQANPNITSSIEVRPSFNSYVKVSDSTIKNCIFVDQMYYHRFPWYATFENKTPAETFPKFPSIMHVIDRSDRNSPITVCLAWRKEGVKVTPVAVIGGFRSDLSIARKTDGNFRNVSAGVFVFEGRVSRKTVVIVVGVFPSTQQHDLI